MPTEKEEVSETPPPTPEVPKEQPQYAIQKQADKWHSKMENFLSEKLPGKGPPKQLKTMIQGWANKGQFKQEELAWSGLNDDDQATTKRWVDPGNDFQGG